MSSLSLDLDPQDQNRAWNLSPEERAFLLNLAKDSIRYGLEHGRQMPLDTATCPAALQAPGASFVTLHCDGKLRGCIGNLMPARPLALDVVGNAYAAAFRDPRFPPLTASELDALTIHVSLLSPMEPLQFESEEELLAQLRPGTDGLVIEEPPRRSTFLPTVWESLPNPRDFLRHLKLKAGLPANYWSGTLRALRYTVESIP